MPGPILNPDIKVGHYYFQTVSNNRTGNILWVTGIDTVRGLYICDILNLHECKVFTDKPVPLINIDASTEVPIEIKTDTLKMVERKLQHAFEKRIDSVKKFFGK